jgi:hypothetical protein
MSPQPQYGSIKDSDEDLDVELLATTHVGDVDATGSDDDRGGGSTSSSWSGSSSRHRRVSYALLTALAVCLFSARYWHDNRAAAGVGGGGGSRDDDGGRSSSSGGGGGGIGGGRVPVTPALSALDPSSDLGFRVATRTGDALPSSAWGAHREKKSFSSGGSSSFAPLPTNQWYLVSSSPEGAYISRGGGARRSARSRTDRRCAPGGGRPLPLLLCVIVLFRTVVSHDEYYIMPRKTFTRALLSPLPTPPIIPHIYCVF